MHDTPPSPYANEEQSNNTFSVRCYLRKAYYPPHLPYPREEELYNLCKRFEFSNYFPSQMETLCEYRTIGCRDIESDGCVVHLISCPCIVIRTGTLNGLRYTIANR
ncbi:hypothetical protein DPMN_057085 [Dreissena polymorpha]|uniref:Uncharacterized protein n=1 Tax=Dreissena polymorpha TaxID=45954 RepID=A0A9D4HU78_DREPO|nr:hypothetical protein DPMN_057085 [Dreissena polymorpha]